MDNNNGWISVKDKLPEADGFYLIYPYNELDGNVFTAAWESDHFEVWVNSPVSHVTHWMPLPSPPKTSDNNG